MAKEGLHFDFDERTEVPTYEEISSVLPKLEKHKKTIGYLSIIILLIAVFSGTGFAIYKYRGNIQTFLTTGQGSKLTGNAIGGIGDFMTNDINYSNENKFGITIEKVKINLTKEEATLTNELKTICENEKEQTRAETEKENENECANEKATLNTRISNLEIESNSWKEKYGSCKERLDDYE